jgi:DNA helicase II / ATP-dependent DNA helicase PcrA
MADFINDLNASQKAAVLATKGPVMVIAGAGSGKTRVLTYRVAQLLDQGVQPFHILALTFTNKAAREMRERIARLVDPSSAKSLWMGTFHSIFARMLRAEAPKLGFPNNFTIYDTDDSKRVIRNILKEQQLDDKTYSPSYVLSRISNAKNNLISPSDYNEDSEIQTQDTQARKPKLGLIYSLYQKKLMKASAMDFDDLLFNTNVLLRDFPEVLYKYQQRFEYILVDEYQDTNFSQYLIVKKLAANNENICVVGDDAQSIYAFRGANIQNILNFKNDYPDCQLFKLEQNYRSTQHIVNAANSVIAQNKDQIFKKVWTSNAAGEKVQVIKTASEAEEASWLAARIFGLKANQQLPHSAFAVLYRTNAQSRALEESLRKLNIPYRIYGGVSFYQRKEVKDVLAYFRLIINPMDEDAFLRIVNFPARGIGQTTVTKLLAAANDTGRPLWEIACDPKGFQLGFNSGTVDKLERFTSLIKSFEAQLFRLSAFELGERIVNQSGIRKFYFDEGSPESLNRRENIEELLNGLQEFVAAVENTGPEAGTGNPPDSGTGNVPASGPGSVPDSAAGSEPDPGLTPAGPPTLDEFMQDIALLTDADIKSDDGKDNNKVSLMTIHAAKGLEFPYVFITGVEENLFPSQLSINSRQELEEERRLFYVALTRAMNLATISYAETRFRYGNFNLCEPSRFIDELDSEFVHYLVPPGLKRKTHASQETFRESLGRFKKVSDTRYPVHTGESIQPPARSTTVPARGESGKEAYAILSPDMLAVNMRVEHPRFGQGTVTAMEGNAQNAKATVEFARFGKKQLLLKFARLKILDA